MGIDAWHEANILRSVASDQASFPLPKLHHVVLKTRLSKIFGVCGALSKMLYICDIAVRNDVWPEAISWVALMKLRTRLHSPRQSCNKWERAVL